MEVLRQARLAGGFAYREVADRMGVDPSYIAHLETGRVQPSPARLECWRNILRRLIADRISASAAALAKLAS